MFIHKHKIHLLFLLLLLLMFISLGTVSANASRVNQRASVYPTVNDQVRNVNTFRDRHGNNNNIIRSCYGPKITFKKYAYLSQDMAGAKFYVQSLNVTPDDRYAYIGYDHDPTLRHWFGYTRIVRYNLKNQHYKVSRIFRGGHGQAMGYNPFQKSLWLLDVNGPVNSGFLDQINLKTLLPDNKIRFKMSRGQYLGNTLTFDTHNNLYNVRRIWRNNVTKQYKYNNVVLCRGWVSKHHSKFYIIKQGLRRTPAYYIQDLAYNPKTDRLYMLDDNANKSNDAIVSIPVNRLGHLRPQDVKETVFKQHREFEGLSFDQRGYAYLMTNGPKELFKSTKSF